MNPDHTPFFKVKYETAIQKQQEFYGSKVLGFGFEVPSPVVTLGLSAKESDEVLVEDRGFEVLKTDRGGKATLHSPGQLVLFPVWEFKDAKVGLKNQICVFLKTVSRRLGEKYGIDSSLGDDLGLYTSVGKIAFAGLRVKNRRVYHGFSLNVCNDLTEFGRIKSCGVSGRSHDCVQRYTESRMSPELIFSELASSIFPSIN